MKIEEYFYPTINFKPYGKEYENYPITDYAEIELIPDDNDEILKENLDRFSQRAMFTEDELREIDDPNSDAYEHIICYVHFKKGTYELDRTPIEVITTYDSVPIEIWNKLEETIKKEIVDKAIESIKKWRNINQVINEQE